jgi:hypothetical protein
MPRAKIHFTQGELRQLKTDVNSLCEGRKYSVTTNEALSAVLLKSFAEEWGFSKSKVGKASMVINGQGKGLFHNVKNTCGNFSWSVERNFEKAPQEMSIVEAVDFYHELGNQWRSKEESAKVTEAMARFAATKSFENPATTPCFSINNQAVFNMAQIRFGRDASCIGYSPWHSVDQIHIVAALEPEANRPSSVKRYSRFKKLIGPLDASAAFERIDADNSGDISREELLVALKDAGLEIPDHEVDELMEMIDADRSNTIDVEKFDAAFYASRLSGGMDVYVPVPKGKLNKGVEDVVRPLPG